MKNTETLKRISIAGFELSVLLPITLSAYGISFVTKLWAVITKVPADERTRLFPLVRTACESVDACTAASYRYLTGDITLGKKRQLWLGASKTLADITTRI